MLADKRELFKRYQKVFAKVGGVNLIQEPEHCKSNCWLQTPSLNGEQQSYRDIIFKATNDVSYMTRPVWNAIHELTPFKDCPRMELIDTESLHC
ncbi:MAG: perosamine synthetase [Candidatus Endobugula sp.]|jgi:perosamine synthetase